MCGDLKGRKLGYLVVAWDGLLSWGCLRLMYVVADCKNKVSFLRMVVKVVCWGGTCYFGVGYNALQYDVLDYTLRE